MNHLSNSGASKPPTPEQRIKELEVQLKDAQEKAQLFEAVLDVLKKDYGVRVVKRPLGKSSRKSSLRIPVNVTTDSGNVTGNSGERDRWVGVARFNFMPSCFFG